MINAVTDTSDVTALLERLYASFGTGDPSGWIDSLAPDVLLIGTDPGEWWQGRDAVIQVIRTQLNEMGSAGIRLEGGAPVIVGSQDVVWVADRPILHLGYDAELLLRLTMIATRAGGSLLVQHIHLSLGVPNQEVLTQGLNV
jgi:hypothetical protein